MATVEDLLVNTGTTGVSDAAYRQLMLAAEDRRWELHAGQLRKKPDMTAAHNMAYRRLGRQLMRQLDADEWEIFIDNGKVHRPSGGFYLPDLFVAPMSVVRALLVTPRTFEEYEEPLPLVVEVWSPSTGAYDVDEKVPVYQELQDREIWRIHPYERTVTVWRRRPDGNYDVSVHRGGTVSPIAFPQVTIAIDALFG